MLENNQKTLGYAWYALALLTLVYVLNFLDRQIIYFLFPLIKKEMSFSDTQLALFGTSAFAIFYTILGIPFGRLADRGSRKNMIAAGLAIWSLFSGLTGFANDFWTLFLCRVMVGVGEATLGPAAISLLSDYFSPTRRATVTSVYSMGITIGAALAAFLGGWIGLNYGWRWTFYLLGFPGLVFAALVFLLREPARGATAAPTETKYSNADWQGLLANQSFIWLCTGYALLGLATNNLSIWGAIFYTSVHKLDLATIGVWGGILTLAAGVPATLFGGVIADWFRRRSRGGRMLYGALLAFVSIPFWLIFLFARDYHVVFFAQFILLGAGLAWLGAAAADATEIAGVHLRGLAVAIYFFAVNFAAYLIGSILIGQLNDLTGTNANPEMLRYTLLVCPASCLLSAVCLRQGSRSLNLNDRQTSN